MNYGEMDTTGGFRASNRPETTLYNFNSFRRRSGHDEGISQPSHKVVVLFWL